MSGDRALSGRRARANRLRWWWQQNIGWPGAAALALVAIAVLLASWARPAIDAQQRELARQQAVRLAAPARPPAPLGAPNPADPRDLLRTTIPALPRRGEAVAQMLDLAGHAGVAIDRAEYAAEDQEPALSRLRVTLPFGGSYAQTRAAIARLLNGLPNAALDSVEIERPSTEVKGLEGTLRLSLYFRKDAP